MEPIPEDCELRTSEQHSRFRELYSSERVDTAVRTVPEYLLQDWEFSPDTMNTDMAHYVTDQLGAAATHSSAYTYSYEGAYEQPLPEIEEQHTLEVDGNIERHSTETKRVTRVTKVTSSRSVKTIPVPGPESPVDGYIFDSGGGVIMDDQYGNVVPYENGGLVEEFQALRASQQQYGSYSDYVSPYAFPSQPGAPQIVDVESDEVTLVWLRPDRAGDEGDLEGYQVHFRLSGQQEQDWHPAHSGLIADTQCKISNLEPNSEYQFRVVAKNSSGFGEASTPSAAVQLRPKYMQYGGVGQTPGVPCPPGQPQVQSMSASSALLSWDPPVSSGAGGPVAGYQVEYRASGGPNWVVSNDYLITNCKYEVPGLRPNGDYEFRVLARNSDGFSEPSQSSGMIRIRPLSGSNAVPLAPSQPQVIDADSDWVTLMWAAPPMPRGSTEPWQLLGYVLESREIGDPTWYSASDRLISSTQLTVRGLHPNSTYEFRVFAKSPAGLSDPSEVSELVQLRPKFQGAPRGVPGTPQAPQIMPSETANDQVTLCWLPAHSALPVQGYDVEFTDLTQDPAWYKVNDLLMQHCKMTIGDLMMGHEYQFRVIAKNAMGYSEPSEASEPVIVGLNESPSVVVPPSASNMSMPSKGEMPSDVQIQDELVRESPPIPDRDDSPPPIHRPPWNGHDAGVQWRDPTLPEVLDYLSSPNNGIRLNAAGYLQHLTYHDDENKRRVRELGGVPRLVEILASDVPEIQKNAAGCLRNLAYGRQNDDNKRAIKNAGGIPALVSVLRKTPDMQVKDEVSGTLWNLSSCDELKRPILEQAADTLVKQVIIPGSGWSPSGQFSDPNRAYNPNVFKNGTGVLRNVSAATEAARKMLRESPNLVDALVHFLHLAVLTRGEADTTPVQNVVCVLRNLSYRCQEVEDPNYDRPPPPGTRERSKSAPSGSPRLKNKKDSKFFNKKQKDGDSLTASPSQPRPTKGMALLWQPEIAKLYLKLLAESSSTPTLESSAGAIQNLCACYWQPSTEIRATVRKEKGLPILVELLRLPEDSVNCTVAHALRNLAMDPRNKELIGKYAMKDLVHKLPRPQQTREPGVSDSTVAAALAVIYETTRDNSNFTRILHETGGTERLMWLSRSPHSNPKVVKYASQVLHTMWQHKDLHDMFKRAGYREQDFFVYRSRGPGETTTLARPISTQGPERPINSRLRPDLEEDGTRYGAVGSTASLAGSSYGTPTPRAQDAPLRSVNGKEHHYHRPPSANYGSPSSEPLYAQVQKRNGHGVYSSANRGSQPQQQPAGDSWV